MTTLFVDWVDDRKQIRNAGCRSVVDGAHAVKESGATEGTLFHVWRHSANHAGSGRTQVACGMVGGETYDHENGSATPWDSIDE